MSEDDNLFEELCEKDDNWHCDCQCPNKMYHTIEDIKDDLSSNFRNCISNLLKTIELVDNKLLDLLGTEIIVSALAKELGYAKVAMQLEGDLEEHIKDVVEDNLEFGAELAKEDEDHQCEECKKKEIENLS